jgi:serine/threonine protein kinase
MSSKPLQPGDPRRLGHFHLLARLGEGGMGVVYLGRDRDGRSVAIKTVRAELAGREEFRARFRSEMQRVRQVPSFCTAAVVDADPDHEIPYLAVEYVDGPSLSEVVSERGPVPAGDLHSVAVGVAAALTAIHGAGVIHRDLKPSNVLLSLGLPKVIDFGIARALEVTSQYTRTDQMVGTVAYMAPERLDSTLGEITPAADIFAWGAVVTYAGTGRSPFRGDSPMSTAARILTAEPDLTGLPESLVALVGRALAKHPDDRPTAAELVQQLLAAPAPQPEQRVRPAARYGARDLLEQLIEEAPTPVARPAVGRIGARDLLAQLVDQRPPVRPVDEPPPPVQPPAPRPAASRHGARDLLAQLVDQRPEPPPAHRSAEPSVPPVPRSSTALIRRVLYAVAAVLVLTVAGAAVASARDDDPPPSSSALPPSDAASANTLSLPEQPALSDPLSAPARFRESSGEGGSCRYEGGQLHGRATGRRTYQCAGPADVFAGDMSITMTVTLANAGSCAMVWFRYREGLSYQLSACPDRLVMETIDGAILNTTGKQPATLQTGTPHQLAVQVTGQSVSVAVDGAERLRAGAGNAVITSGRVLLGVSGAPPGGTSDVRFADLSVRANF